jgi:hypothetical protein
VREKRGKREEGEEGGGREKHTQKLGLVMDPNVLHPLLCVFVIFAVQGGDHVECQTPDQGEGREKGEGRREKGEGRKEKGEGRKEKGERRKEKEKREGREGGRREVGEGREGGRSNSLPTAECEREIGGEEGRGRKRKGRGEGRKGVDHREGREEGGREKEGWKEKITSIRWIADRGRGLGPRIGCQIWRASIRHSNKRSRFLVASAP